MIVKIETYDFIGSTAICAFVLSTGSVIPFEMPVQSLIMAEQEGLLNFIDNGQPLVADHTHESPVLYAADLKGGDTVVLREA